MIARSWGRRFAAAGAAGMLCAALAWCAEPPDGAEKHPAEATKPASARQSRQSQRVTVAVARDRAKLAHRIYESTLRVMHHRYFHGDKAVVPARAMQDVFFDIAWQEKLEAKWISVNTPAMSLEHEPQSEFEKRAAQEIAKGKDAYEAVEKGSYRRAGAIALGASCVNCHTGFLQSPPKTARFAALVISVPVQDE